MSYSGYLYHGGIGYSILSALGPTAIGAVPWISTSVTAISALTMYRDGWASERILAAIFTSERAPA